MDIIAPFLFGLLLGAASICAAIVRYTGIRKLVKEAEGRSQMRLGKHSLSSQWPRPLGYAYCLPKARWRKATRRWPT